MTDKKVISIDDQLEEVKKKQANQPKWQNKFIFKTNSKGEPEGIKTTARKNVLLILNNDPNLKGVFKYNKFTRNIDVTKNRTIDLSKQGVGIIKFTCGALKDADINNLGVYFEAYPSYHVIFKSQLIMDALDVSARQHAYNPLVDYFEDAYKNWDHKARISDFLPTYLGAAKNETNDLIIRQWLIGAVAKAYDPKTKFDLVLDLVGGQGAGKTTLLQKIAPLGLYTDQFSTFTKVDDFEVMKNALIVNDDEMTASNKATFEETKKFITMQFFDYRKAYGRLPEKFPKKFVIARTSNEIAHLKDRSGDRRFMSILVNSKNQLKHPVNDLKPDYIKQLWGEAVWLYKNAKDPFELTEHQQDLLVQNREEFKYTTEIEESLDDALNQYYKNVDFIPTKKLAFKLYGTEDGFQMNRKDYQKVKYYMEHLGYKTARKRIDGEITRGFEKV